MVGLTGEWWVSGVVGVEDYSIRRARSGDRGLVGQRRSIGEEGLLTYRTERVLEWDDTDNPTAPTPLAGTGRRVESSRVENSRSGAVPMMRI